jgi:pSer/pThr/pTyr-binding forkhead associated (FHA) protein
MKSAPLIVVQLVHIAGPLKGEIQEYSCPVISIGRHSSCQLRFPADLTGVSRKHAEIVREGNRFKLVDHSTNGTFLNGKGVKEALLKNGDVIALSEGGPKISFLTQMKEGAEEVEPPPSQKNLQEASIPVGSGPVPVYRESNKPDPRPSLLKIPRPSPQILERKEDLPSQPVSAPLFIQYGPTLRSFKKLPVTVGKSSKCDCIIDHPSIHDLHAQIFYVQNQYWIKDLTGLGLIQINRQPAGFQVLLKTNDDLSLSPQGPVFRFLGEGRLVEVTEAPVPEPTSSDQEKEEPSNEAPPSKPSRGILSRFKKTV